MAAVGAEGPDFPYFRQIISVFLLFFTLSLQTPLRYGKVTHSETIYFLRHTLPENGSIWGSTWILLCLSALSGRVFYYAAAAKSLPRVKAL